MSVVPNKQALKRRLDRYFWENDSEEMSRLTRVLKSQFCRFENVFVIGGLVRDFARAGRSGFDSDVDLVIDAPASEVEMVAMSLAAKPNRFGGFGCAADGWKIDFWALETTWALRNNYIKLGRPEDIIFSTFFDWDEAGYDLWRRKVIVEDDYFKKLNSRILDLNVIENPSPIGNLVRAVRRIVLWNVVAGDALRSFILDNLDDKTLCEVQAVERRLYAVRVSTGWRDAREAKRYLLRR